MKQNLVKTLPFGTTVEGKKNGAFLALTFKSKIYKGYDDPSVDEEQMVDLVFMNHRWDGLQGFIGGFVDGGETLEECAIREAKEEINIDVSGLKLEPLCTHELDRVVVHLYHLPYGEIDVSALKALLTSTMGAKHLVAEGNPILMHLKTYDKWGKGLKNTINSNTLASAVKEELEALCKKLEISIEYQGK